MSHGGPIFAALPSLLTGTMRQPLPTISGVDGRPLADLQALSLVGQASRFAPPSSPAAFEVEHVAEDSRRIVPDALRRPMLRILGGKMATEHPAMAIARTLDEQHLRPHPFDLPKLDAFVRRHAERLGTTAQQWSRRKAEVPEVQLGYDDRESLDDASWTQSSVGRRVEYLCQRRREDPAAARALLEAAWTNEPAESRLRLLEVIGLQLSAGDQLFLEMLEKDRAPRVRSMAVRLLARLGSRPGHAALTACLERIKRTESGFLRKRPSLGLELPATVKEHAAPGWIQEAFEDVALEELSRALDLSVSELVDASAKDANMPLALALMATAQGRVDVLDAVVQHLPDAWQRLSTSGIGRSEMMTRDERQRWASALIAPYGKNLPWDYSAWAWLHTMLDAPAPPSLLDAVFRSSWFDEPPTVAKHTVQWMEITAALCPAVQRRQLRERLAGFEPALTTTALPLLDLLDALKNEDAYV